MSSPGELEEQTREFLERVDHTRVDQFAFRGAQYDAGLAWAHFPVGKGGLGRSRADQSVVDAAFRAAGCRIRTSPSTIEGGTWEIMRNILGERVLRLPGDIRVDKDVPWSHIPT